MRGANIRYLKLGVLLKEGRLRKHMELADACMLIGISTPQYLWRCEKGLSNFPVSLLKRALEIYGIPSEHGVEVMVKDFAASMREFLEAE